MPKLSLKSRIKNYLAEWYYLDHRKYIHGGEIERLALANGYKPSDASRPCRELEQEGKIEKIYNCQNHVLYRYDPSGDTIAIIT